MTERANQVQKSGRVLVINRCYDCMHLDFNRKGETICKQSSGNETIPWSVVMHTFPAWCSLPKPISIEQAKQTAHQIAEEAEQRRLNNANQEASIKSVWEDDLESEESNE